MNPNRIPKFCDATEKKDRSKCLLFITEGDTIHEDEQIIVYENEQFFDVKIKDVNVGDLILTHNNRLRKILGISKKVIEGVKIKCGDIEHIVSPEHRLIAYDKTTKTFLEVRAKDLDSSVHALVKNRLADTIALGAIKSVTRIEDEKYDLHLDIEYIGLINSTMDHKFYVWDRSTGSFCLVSCENLNTDKHSLVLF